MLGIYKFGTRYGHCLAARVLSLKLQIPFTSRLRIGGRFGCEQSPSRK